MKSVNQRREEGDVRNAEWQALTFPQQIDSLDARLGRDLGAQRQRARIRGRMIPTAAPGAISEKDDKPVESPVTSRRKKGA